MVRPKAASHMKNKVINGYYLKMLEEWDFVTEVLKDMLRNEGNGGNRNYASTNSHQSNPFQSNQFQSNQLPIQRIHHKNNISDWSVKITNLLRYIDNYGMSKVILKNDVNYLNSLRTDIEFPPVFITTHSIVKDIEVSQDKKRVTFQYYRVVWV